MASTLELQQKLYKRMGLDVPEPKPQRNGRPKSSHQLSRKEQRKAQRVQKKSHVYTRPTQQRPQPTHHTQKKPSAPPRTPQNNKPPPKSKQVSEDEDDEDEDDDEEEDLGDMSLDEDEEEGEDPDDSMDEDEEEEDEDDESETETKSQSKNAKKGVSKAVQERLNQDDAEIEAFERKLGIKKGRKSLPQSFKEDGLGDLLGDLSGEEDLSENDNDNKKRKSEYDEWLASKRRKTAEPPSRAKGLKGDDLDMDEDSGDEDDDLDLMDEDDDDGGDFDDDDSFGGFDDDDAGDDRPAEPRQRENPYVAPTSGVAVAKYVPPSLRKAAGSDDERKSRLRKQVQGLINRLTDANILSIVKSVEELYQNNARGDVSDIITDAIMAQISKPETLPDQFFVLTGGFAAATYRLVGSSFGTVLLRRIVEDFKGHYEQASKELSAESAIQKEASNILTLLTQLYVFEVVTCKIIFDYMEKLLGDLNEINVELLLRICRMAGRILKQDDERTLKHVAGVLNQSVAKTGFTNISARTKFIVETITDLTKGKRKAKGLDSTVVSEHVQRMKKRLVELKSQARRLNGLSPLAVGLVDIEEAETRGQWWLTSASVPSTLMDKSKKGRTSDTEMSDHEDMDIVLPDYPKKARAQGLNGTAQIAIFTALMTASNFEHAYRQFVNLKLKKDDQLALATVLVQCAGSEMQYNPYYALVGGKACMLNSRIRFAIQDRLWKIFRSLGESMFGEAPEEDETADAERMKDERRITNVAKFYADLVADGTLNIAILKPLELPETNHWASMFVQLFIIALMKECRSKKKAPQEDIKLEKIFGAARDLPGLAAGIHWMLRKKIRKTKLISAKELKKLEGVIEKVQIIVRPAAIEI